MNHFKKILFPVEFSKRDHEAAPFVLSMVQRYHAQLVVLHVLQPPVQAYFGMDGIYPEAFDTSSSVAPLRALLSKLVAEQLPNTAAECVVDVGDPAATITQFALNNGVDLIAMPTHGYGLFRRTLLGSVTAKVLHDSTLPVWTSAHVPDLSHRAHPQPRRVLCAIDLKPGSRHTLEVAICVAKDAGASLELVHVPAETVSPQAAEQHLSQLLAETEAFSILKIQQVPWLGDKPEGETGSVAEGVRNLALHTRADLVVIGRGAIQTMLGGLNSHSYGIIRESPCPVLSV